MKVRISDHLELPADYVTQRAAVLATSGAGKSNLAAVIAEGLYRAKLPFAVVDPEGSWYGLRSSRDGKSPGLEVVIFGGDHADVPLEAGSGPEVARFLGESHVSCVLDVSEMSESGKMKWLTEFGRELYRRNRDPYHLILEEADEYLMQRPIRKDQVACLSVWQHLVKRGRKRGLGVTLITQRSATLNKDVLTQIGTLFVLRTTAPQDRKAIAAWLEFQAQSKDVLESLPKLKDGACWVWSPQWLGTMERAQVNLRETFDSGATPKGGGTRPAATLADVDLAAVSKRFTDSIERAKQDDPKELRRRIAELERDLRQRPNVEPERVEVPALDGKDLERLEKATDHLIALEQELVGDFTAAVEGLREQIRIDAPARLAAVVEPLGEPLERIVKALSRLNGGVHGKADRRGISPAPRGIPPAPGRSHRRGDRPSERPRTVGPDVEGLTGPERRILDAIAWFEAIGIEEPTQVGVAFLAGYTIGGGAWNNPRGRLHTKGLVEYRGERIRLTDGGRSLANHPEAPLTAEELQARVMERIDGPMRRILEPLLRAYPDGMTNEDLADAAGYSQGGGAYNNPRGRLRTLGLIEYDAGIVRAAPVLFLEA